MAEAVLRLGHADGQIAKAHGRVFLNLRLRLRLELNACTGDIGSTAGGPSMQLSVTH